MPVCFQNYSSNTQTRKLVMRSRAFSLERTYHANRESQSRLCSIRRAFTTSLTRSFISSKKSCFTRISPRMPTTAYQTKSCRPPTWLRMPTLPLKTQIHRYTQVLAPSGLACALHLPSCLPMPTTLPDFQTPLQAQTMALCGVHALHLRTCLPMPTTPPNGRTPRHTQTITLLGHAHTRHGPACLRMHTTPPHRQTNQHTQSMALLRPAQALQALICLRIPTTPGERQTRQHTQTSALIWVAHQVYQSHHSLRSPQLDQARKHSSHRYRHLYFPASSASIAGPIPTTSSSPPRLSTIISFTSKRVPI